MLKKPFFCLIVFLLNLLLIKSTAWPWSSTIATMDFSYFKITTNAFGTHQYLSQTAFDALKEHPVLKSGFVKFPSAEEIFRHGSINQGQAGLGPDNPHNSLYSWHWYNPNLEYEKG